MPEQRPGAAEPDKQAQTLDGRPVDDRQPVLPGGAAEVWHCGVPMAHQASAMRWTVREGAWQPGGGVGGQVLACPRCGARARVELEVPAAGWVPPRAELAAEGAPERCRRVARRAAVAEWWRRAAAQVEAEPEEHAGAVAAAVVDALAAAGLLTGDGT